MERLYSYPLYQQLAIVMVVGSLLLCLFCHFYGRMITGAPSRSNVLPEPPLFPGSSFPTIWDTGYTLLFAAAYTAMVVWSVKSDGDMQLSATTVCSTFLIYAPMVVRLACLKRPRLPKGTWVKALFAIPVALFAVFFANMLLEMIRVSQWITDMTHCPLEQNVVESFRRGGDYNQLMIAISACIVAPIGEECFFRGFLYNILKGSSGAVAAALCTSLFFGAVHGALLQLLPLISFGLVQCYLYERFRTLWVPMVFHAIFNGISLSLVFFNVMPS